MYTKELEKERAEQAQEEKQQNALKAVHLSHPPVPVGTIKKPELGEGGDENSLVARAHYYNLKIDCKKQYFFDFLANPNVPEIQKEQLGGEELLGDPDNKLCVICSVEEKGAVFIPCGHVLCCY